MEKDSERRVVIVKPGLDQDWRVAMEGRSGDLSFSARQLAIDFARAYARLGRAKAIQVFNATGVLEHEERVEFALQGNA